MQLLEDFEKAKKGVMPITHDLIHELRIRGYTLEASQLLQAHYKSKEKLKKNIIQEIKAKDSKIRRFIRKKKSLCVFCGFPVFDKKSLCGRCSNYQKTWRDDKKLKIKKIIGVDKN